MLQEEFTPLEIDEASLAYGAHQEVGHGGHFLGAAHTLERFRTCFYRPLLSSTENFERWKRRAARDATERAGEIWRETLEEYEQPPLDDGIRDAARGVRRPPPHRARRLTGHKERPWQSGWRRAWAGSAPRPRSRCWRGRRRSRRPAGA